MLGKIEQVDLRTIWEHEARNFTTWLAQLDNFNILSDEIGIDMQILETEANVGNFSADILAEEVYTGKKVIIENQLEITNHDHLGKLITYASGLEAKYVIWIFKEIREEHRSAIDWLNENTDENINFFAIKMEVWKIENSLPAPVFNIICAPNNWQKAYKKNSLSQNVTNYNLLQLEFWTGFSEYINSNESQFTSQRAQPKSWYNLKIGTSQAHISLGILINDSSIKIAIYIPNNKELYNTFFEHKSEIETLFGFSLNWIISPNKLSSSISYRNDVINLKDKTEFEVAYKWLLENSTKIKTAFDKYL